MIPEHWRDDEKCEADWVRRFWVEGTDEESALAESSVAVTTLFAEEFAEDTDLMPSDFPIMALYPGHIFDLFQP